MVFVKDTMPGDVVKVQLSRNRKSFSSGFVLEYLEYSKDRLEPFCEHFDGCGGCKWQFIPYKQQAQIKQDNVFSALSRIGGLKDFEFRPIVEAPAETHYRNKLEYTFSHRRWLSSDEIASGKAFGDEPALGFHAPGLFDKVVPVTRCFLQEDLGNKIRNRIDELAKENNWSYYHIREKRGLLRNLILRNTLGGEWMLVLVIGEENMDCVDAVQKMILDEFPQISSYFTILNQKANDSISDLEATHRWGETHITEVLDGTSYKIGPKSFFQTNPGQTLNLYRGIKEAAALKGDELIYDLYCGAGTIGLFMAGDCKEVHGLEYVPEAVEDAHLNMEINEIQNASFEAGDMKDMLTQEWCSEKGVPDIIVTDPPRAGMHESVVKALVELAAPTLIYVSCNPATQARDLEILSEVYKLDYVQAYDLFPHTPHVESLAKLSLKA